MCLFYRLLGFGRVPPTVGRNINLTEFKDLAPRSVSETFYKSPGKSVFDTVSVTDVRSCRK